ncbi:MAG: tetratricopeptide repeat protein [Planctomycetota bacterium]
MRVNQMVWPILYPTLLLAFGCAERQTTEPQSMSREADELTTDLNDIQEPEQQRFALDQLRVRAAQGDPEANFRLGQAYSNGLGVEKDSERAFEHFLASAEAGLAKSQVLVALMFHTGEGTQHDGEEVIKWCTRAAEQDNELAQYWLGIFHEGGVYVSRDPERAFELYTKASDAGLAEAQAQLACCFALESGTIRDMAEAERWYRTAFKNGADLQVIRSDLSTTALAFANYPKERMEKHRAKFENVPSKPCSDPVLSHLTQEQYEYDQMMMELQVIQRELRPEIQRLSDAIALIDQVAQQ